MKRTLALAYAVLLFLVGCQGQHLDVPSDPPPYQLSIAQGTVWAPPSGEATLNLTFRARSGYWGVVRLEARTEMEEGVSRFFSLWPDSFNPNGQKEYITGVRLRIAPDTPSNPDLPYRVYVWALDQAGQVLSASSVDVVVSPEPPPWMQ